MLIHQKYCELPTAAAGAADSTVRMMHTEASTASNRRNFFFLAGMGSLLLFHQGPTLKETGAGAGALGSGAAPKGGTKALFLQGGNGRRIRLLQGHAVDVSAAQRPFAGVDLNDLALGISSL